MYSHPAVTNYSDLIYFLDRRLAMLPTKGTKEFPFRMVNTGKIISPDKPRECVAVHILTTLFVNGLAIELSDSDRRRSSAVLKMIILAEGEGCRFNSLFRPESRRHRAKYSKIGS